VVDNTLIAAFRKKKTTKASKKLSRNSWI